jgi:hypothetical protein
MLFFKNQSTVFCKRTLIRSNSVIGYFEFDEKFYRMLWYFEIKLSLIVIFFQEPPSGSMLGQTINIYTTTD